jgi:hypothetical protein
MMSLQKPYCHGQPHAYTQEVATRSQAQRPELPHHKICTIIPSLLECSPFPTHLHVASFQPVVVTSRLEYRRGALVRKRRTKLLGIKTFRSWINRQFFHASCDTFFLLLQFNALAGASPATTYCLAAGMVGGVGVSENEAPPGEETGPKRKAQRRRRPTRRVMWWMAAAVAR